MANNKQVDVDLHDDVDNEIVEDSLDEAKEPKGGGGSDQHAQQVSEPEALGSVDGAENGKQAPARRGDNRNSEKSHLPKTKASMINAMYQKMAKMKKGDLQASYKKMMGEDVELEDESVLESVDTQSELDQLVENEATLSEEFKEKATTLFETALNAKVSEKVTELEESYQEQLDEATNEIKSDLVEKVDSYLNYVVETWMEDNKLAIQNGLRTEIAESFMEKMKDLFTESYIEVPESKVDLVDELAEQVEELEEKLNEQTGNSISMAEELETLKKEKIISEASRGLADTQAEKLKELAESVDFESADAFQKKVDTIKESYFSKKVAGEVEEISESLDDADAESIEVSDVMSRYISAIKATSKVQ